jgi:hypothetical protein
LSDNDNTKDETNAPTYPSEILKCPGDKTELLTSTASFKKVHYEELVKEIHKVHDKLATKTEQTAFAGCLLRLEGHDLMDFRRVESKGKVRRGAAKKEGGSDGCVNFKDPDNKGLPTCLAKAKIETVYADYCDRVSLADFMVIAAEAVVGRLAVDYDAKDPFKAGTLQAKFRD